MIVKVVYGREGRSPTINGEPKTEPGQAMLATLSDHR